MDDLFASKDERESTDCKHQNREHSAELRESVILIRSRYSFVLDENLSTCCEHASAHPAVLAIIDTVGEVVESDTSEINREKGHSHPNSAYRVGNKKFTDPACH